MTPSHDPRRSGKPGATPSTSAASDGRPVRDIMCRRIFVVPPSLGVHDVASWLLTHDVGAAPVIAEDGAVLGVVSRSDLLTVALPRAPRSDMSTGHTVKPRPGSESRLVFPPAIAPAPDEPTAADLMTPVAFGVAPDATIGAAADLLISGRIHRALVIEEQRLVGIVTALDLVHELRHH